MPNTIPQFNPAYSTVKAIYLTKEFSIDNKTLNIARQNTECRFEKMEIVENVNDILPSGNIIVTDLKDVPTFIAVNEIKHVIIEFFDGKKWYCDITSVSYVNNAASDNDDTLVGINFTNLYYTYFSSYSLNLLLGYKKPTVFKVTDFVSKLKSLCGVSAGYNDPASNFFLYKPLNPYSPREETPSDNLLTMLNYVSTMAIDKNKDPNFMFWTSMNGEVNFKSFKKDPTQDPSFATIDADYRNIGIFDADAVLQKLTDNKVYRKAYFFATNPAYQWISKNYYYIRKTPKYLDELPPLSVPAGLSGATLQNAISSAEEDNRKQAIKNLSFHFQDDGQKYNIDVVSILGRGTEAPYGAELITPEHDWGYFDGLAPSNNRSITNMLGNQYGTQTNYKGLELMGASGFMPFIDNPDMWKNMFDITPIHPQYPDENSLTNDPSGVPGITASETYLQAVMDIRYNTFKNIGNTGGTGNTGASRLEKLRQIEAQNFVMYSLCCMGKQEDCFFALLQRYEPDSAYYGGLTGPTGGPFITGSTGPELSNGAKFYRYKWNKIIFNPGSTGTTGACGGSNPEIDPAGGSSSFAGPTGPTGSTAAYQAHQLEFWSLDPTMKSSDLQDSTWAINLNERGLTNGYLPPGWVPSSTTSFKFRPIGATAAQFPIAAGITHIARVCIESTGANSTVTYFWAENVVDGTC